MMKHRITSDHYLVFTSSYTNKWTATSDGSFREIKHNTFPRNFNKRSGAVAEGLGAAVEAGVGLNLTQPSGMSYFFL